VSIVVIGLVAGYAKRLGRSTWAAITVHFVSNLYSAFAG
jgi:membrane protease YdiL (CAAX protease family)